MFPKMTENARFEGLDMTNANAFSPRISRNLFENTFKTNQFTLNENRNGVSPNLNETISSIKTALQMRASNMRKPKQYGMWDILALSDLIDQKQTDIKNRRSNEK